MTVEKYAPTCLATDTLICLPDGTMLPIQKLRVANTVVTHSGYKSSVASVSTRKISGTMLTITVMGPYDSMRMTTFQPIAFYPFIDDEDAANRFDVLWQPAGELAVGNKVLLPWITANKTKFFDEVLRPSGAMLAIPVGTVQSCPHGLICPIIAISITEVVSEKFYTLSTIGDNTFIANGVAVSGS